MSILIKGVDMPQTNEIMLIGITPKLKEKYKQAEGNPQITDPVTWALYRTFQIVKRRHK